MVDRNALARATESTTSPTPGYLYNDISKSAATSPAAASEIATYLIKRLQSKNNVNIKYKCLKVIQMVAAHPATRGQFKRVVIQDTNAISAIKVCLQFRGPPDAVHGDMLYEKVRTQAKETLDAVYSDDPSSEQNHSHGSGGGGYGNQSYGGIGGGGGASSGYGSSYNSSSNYGSSSNSSSIPGGPKKMEGIGNPMFADPRLNQKKDIGEMTIGDVVSGVKEGFVGMIKDPLARNTPTTVGAPRPGGMGGYGGPSGGGGWNSAPPGKSQLTQQTNGAWTMASNRGPNAYNSNTDPYKSGAGNVSSGVGGSWGASPSVASQSRQAAHNPPRNANPIVHLSGNAGAAKSDGTYERNLITELCPPGGMRAEPPPDKLQSFAQAIPNLNPDLTCPALLDALEDGQPWIIRAKALCVMEVCINVADESLKSGLSSNNAYADFFIECRDEIEPLAVHTRIAVRDPAKRVLKALGLEIPNSANVGTHVKKVTAPVAAAPVAVAAPNLLDFDEPSAPTAPVNSPPPLPTGAPPAPPAPTSNGQDLFGGMNLKDSVKQTPAPIPSVPVPSQNDGSDLLGDLSQSKVSEPSSATGGLFDNMAVKAPVASTSSFSAGKENVENDATSSTPAGSGFSFIAGETETAKTQPAAPAKQSFDPLLGLGLDSSVSSNPMQQSQSQASMNPQMAAMVQQQQQQILMMQAQMQQMQMAGNPQMQMAGNTRFMMMQQGRMQNSSNSVGMNAGLGAPMTQNIMGARNGSGVSTSFAFMEDPNKARKDASNKQFEFVQDAMKGAR